MNFGQAISSVFSKYAQFNGRARRSEYWWFVLFYLILDVVVEVIAIAAKTSVPSVILALALLLPSLAVAVRRLHDTGRSGWFILIGIIPLVGAIVLIVFTCQDSESGPNQYGPSPKFGSQPSYGWAVARRR